MSVQNIYIQTEAGRQLHVLWKFDGVSSITEIFVLKKTNVLSHIKSKTPGRCYVAPSVFDKIENV